MTGRSRWWWALLAMIMLVGLVGRLWNLDFDQRQHLHPDERHWALTSAELARQPAPDAHGTVFGPALDWLDGDRSPANAYRGADSFLYGPVMLAGSRAAAGWMYDGVVDGGQPASFLATAFDNLGVPLIDASGEPRFDDSYQVDLVGRLLAALIDTLTIAIVGLIGRRLAGDISGLVAAGFYGSCVLALQHAHFLGSEPLVGLACAFTVLAALRLDRSGDVRAAWSGGMMLGAASGLAVAAKLTSTGLVAVPLIGCVALANMHRRRSDVVRVVVTLATAAVTVRVLMPGAFDGLGLLPSRDFLDDLALARSQFEGDSPPSIQWARRSAVLQPLAWMLRFTLGPGIAIAATFGIAGLVTRLRRDPPHPSGRWPNVVVLASIAVPFVYVAATAVPSGRYYMPIVPVICAVAGAGVAMAWRWSAARSVPMRRAARATCIASVVLAGLWAVGFVNGVHGSTHTRVEATEWIVDNVPPGSVLSSQAWDDSLPLRLPGVDVDAYQIEQLDMVGTDTPAKLGRIATQLGTIDYVVESSPRLWGVVDRIPERFPSTINFFDGLDSGELGFERVATFTSGPRLFGVEVDDSSAEEAFSVYDHPEVRIWEKVEELGRDDIVAVLDPVASANALTIAADSADANGLLLTDVEQRALADGPTFDDTFDTSGSPWLHALGWLVLLELIGVVAFLLMLPIARRLPDAGLGIAKTIGLAGMAVVMFIAGAWLRWNLSRSLVMVVFALTLVAAGLAAWRRRDELRLLWVERRATLVLVESLSCAAFVAMLALRAANPDLWHPTTGGEKPFEQMLLTSVLRTDTLPPYDAWFSGGALNYYYGGYLMLLGPARLLATVPSVLMNIGPAVFASCAVGAAFTAGSAAAATRARLAGGLAAASVVVAANLAVVPAAIDSIGGARFDWWGVSRVIPDSFAITEFPAWSLLFADLHPHLMDICLVLAIGSLSIALFGHLRDDRALLAIVSAAIGGALVGLVRGTNTWDFPLVGAMVVAALGWALALGAQRRTVAWSTAAFVAVVVLLWSPYTSRGLVFDAGVDRNIEPTPFGSWMMQLGVFVAVSIVAVAPVLIEFFRRRSTRTIAVGLTLLAVGAILVWPGSAVFVTCSVLALTLGLTASRQRDAGPLGPVLLAVGWIIVAGVELVTVHNDLGRQNTVFKFWFQSWLVLAIGAAVVLASAWPRARSDRAARAPRSIAGIAAVAIATAAGTVSIVFWALAVHERVDDRISTGGPLLDGEAYLRTDLAVIVDGAQITPGDDLPIIEWLRSEVPGIRTVAEAPGTDYRWSSRISWSTGLPTSVGWQYHETQQRRPYVDAIERRVADLRELYTTADGATIARILDDREVDYVVFGTVERALSTPSSARALRAFQCLDVAFERADHWVAQVDRDCVSEQRPSG